MAYSNLQPALASTMPPRPPSDAVFTDHLASSSLSPGVGPRVGYPQPNTPHYQVASQTSAFQHQQSSKQFPYHTTTGQRRNSTSIPNKGPNRPTPYHPSRSHNLQGIAESSLLPQSRSDATLSGFLVQLTDKLQDHLKAQSNSKPDESSLAALLPTPNMLRYAALCGLWYASSAISNNTGKDILARFRYPVSLTLVQFGIVSFYCVLFCAIRQALSPPLAYQRPWFQILFTPAPPGVLWWKELLAAFGVKRASKTALHGTLIMSFFQITGHVFSSMATASMPVSTVHTIKVTHITRFQL